MRRLRPHVYFCLTLLAFIISTLSGYSQCDAQFDFGANDTICIGETLQFTDQSSTPNGVGTWQWAVNGNILSSITNTADYTFEVDGIYDIQLTIIDVQSACTDQTTQTIIVLGNPDFVDNHTDITCNGLCDGTAEIVFNSDNAAAYEATWQSTLQTDPLENLCVGTYVAEITDTYGCTTAGFTAEVEIQEPSELEAIISNGEEVFACPSDPDVVLNLTVDGGTPSGPAPYEYEWSPAFGLSQTNVEDPLLTPENGNMNQAYSVTVTDGNGCQTVASTVLKPTPSDVTGNITIDGDPCVGCDVVFYIPVQGEWESNQEGTTNSAGEYELNAVPGLTDFLLMVDPNDFLYPNGVQTYYGVSQSTHSWENADQLNSGCSALTQKDIEVISPQQLNGQCTFRGRLFGNIGMNKVETEDPIPLIDVVVEKTPPGAAQAISTTNTEGEFEFNLVPASDTIYTLYVNIPGIPMSNTYSIQVDPEDLVYDGLDLCVSPDTTFIARCSDLISVESVERETPKEPFVYPNPSAGNITLNSGLFENERALVRVFDSSGRLARKWEINDMPNEFSIRSLSSGFYVVQIVNNTRSRSIRISVVN